MSPILPSIRLQVNRLRADRVMANDRLASSVYLFGATDSLRRAHIAAVTAEFVAHCQAERNHQGLGNRLIIPELPIPQKTGCI
jgi:hypothetical protein